MVFMLVVDGVVLVWVIVVVVLVDWEMGVVMFWYDLLVSYSLMIVFGFVLIVDCL